MSVNAQQPTILARKNTSTADFRMGPLAQENNTTLDRIKVMTYTTPMVGKKGAPASVGEKTLQVGPSHWLAPLIQFLQTHMNRQGSRCRAKALVGVRVWVRVPSLSRNPPSEKMDPIGFQNPDQKQRIFTRSPVDKRLGRPPVERGAGLTSQPNLWGSSAARCCVYPNEADGKSVSKTA